MINIHIDAEHIRELLKTVPKEAGRAAEIALDKTAQDIRDAVKDEMQSVFDNPTRYTLNSLKITPTYKHNMEASVWFKEPDRMGQHYLVPQVEGGVRKLKGFERALDNTMFIPGQGVRTNKFGNVSFGQIRQILSVMGSAEHHAGYQANMTARSAKSNAKERDYVWLRKGSAKGKLRPGIYQRVARKGRGFGYKTKRNMGLLGNRTYQKGRTRGKFSSIIRARGLKPILLQGRQEQRTTPLLDFYGVANDVFLKKYRKHFDIEFAKRLSR